MNKRIVRALLVAAGIVAAALILLALYGGPVPYRINRTMDAVTFDQDGTLISRGQLTAEGEGRWFILDTDDFLGTVTLTLNGSEVFRAHVQMMLGEGWTPVTTAEDAAAPATYFEGVMASSDRLLNKVLLSIPQPDGTLLLVYTPAKADAAPATLLNEFDHPLELHKTKL